MSKETQGESVLLNEDEELEFLISLIVEICRCMDKRVNQTQARIVVEKFLDSEGISIDMVPKLVSEIKLASSKPNKANVH